MKIIATIRIQSAVHRFELGKGWGSNIYMLQQEYTYGLMNFSNFNWLIVICLTKLYGMNRVRGVGKQGKMGQNKNVVSHSGTSQLACQDKDLNVGLIYYKLNWQQVLSRLLSVDQDFKVVLFYPQGQDIFKVPGPLLCRWNISKMHLTFFPCLEFTPCSFHWRLS